MNKQSRYYSLNPVKGKLGKVNHKVVSDIKYDTFRRFNSYNAATKLAVLQAVGEKMERLKIGEAGRYIDPPGHWELVEVRPGVWILVWVDDPIDPRATPGRDFRFKDYMHRIDRVAIQRVNAGQQIMHLRGRDGLHITLNVFGSAEQAILQRR